MSSSVAVSPRPRPVRVPSKSEFRAFTGLAMASAAISVDMLLPAFDKIRHDFGLAPHSSATAGLITALFLGMGLGQIPAGLCADRYGRRPVLTVGAVLFCAGALGAMLANSLAPMIVLRFVWGLGTAGMRVCVMAMIRDRFAGVDMAREMAFAMTVFIVVPIVAPLIGSLMLQVFPWRSILAFCAVFGFAIAVWQVRIPETLPIEARQPLQLGQIGVATRAITSSRPTLAYTLAMMPTMGVFASYLASSERVIDDVFHHKSWFPFVFGVTAMAMGAASLTVARIVGRVGLYRIIRIVLTVYTVTAGMAAVISWQADGRPNFWLFFAVFTVTLASHNVIFPNLNSAAMIPVGHVAGTASAIIATLSTVAGAVVGAVIDHVYDGTANPMAISFLIGGLLAILLVWWASRAGSAEP